jgi:hypothetical protein
MEPNKIYWQWTTDNQYFSKSCHNTLFEGVLVSSSWRLNRKSWVPPTVKLFAWLACLDGCWMAERLARRGLPHPTYCPLCDQSDETIRSTSNPSAIEDVLADWWQKAI